MAKVSVLISQEQGGAIGDNSPKILIVGLKNTLGRAIDGELVEVSSESTIQEKFGKNSHIAQSLRLALKINNSRYFLGTNKTKYYAIAFDENSAGTADSRAITFAGTITTAGTIKIAVYSEYNCTVSVNVLATDTITTIASKVKDAFDALEYFPFTTALSGASSEILTFTSIVKGGVFKNFYTSYLQTHPELTITIGAASNGGALPTGIKTAIKNAIDDVNFRFYGVCIEPAFTDGDSTIFDLLDSYKVSANQSRFLHCYNSLCDSVNDIISILSGYNQITLSFAVSKELDGTYAKGLNGDSILNLSSAIASVYARKDTPNTYLNDIALTGRGGIYNMPLSISSLYIPFIKLHSNFSKDDISSLEDKNCGILYQYPTYLTILDGVPDHRTTLTTLSNGSVPTYKYVGQANVEGYIQDHFTRFSKINFSKKMISSGVPNNDNVINVARVKNLNLIELRELADLGLIALSPDIEEVISNKLDETIIFKFAEQRIEASIEIEFNKEVLALILELIPISSYSV